MDFLKIIQNLQTWVLIHTEEVLLLFQRIYCDINKPEKSLVSNGRIRTNKEQNVKRK